jgi:hypothetical protein
MIVNVRKKMIKEYLKVIGLGLLAILFHWKTIAFYLFTAGAFLLMMVEQGIGPALMVIPIMYFLRFIGKFL